MHKLVQFIKISINKFQIFSCLLFTIKQGIIFWMEHHEDGLIGPHKTRLEYNYQKRLQTFVCTCLNYLLKNISRLAGSYSRTLKFYMYLYLQYQNFKVIFECCKCNTKLRFFSPTVQSYIPLQLELHYM